jgi:hypothetical protein
MRDIRPVHWSGARGLDERHAPPDHARRFRQRYPRGSDKMGVSCPNGSIRVFGSITRSRLAAARRCKVPNLSKIYRELADYTCGQNQLFSLTIDIIGFMNLAHSVQTYLHGNTSRNMKGLTMLKIVLTTAAVIATLTATSSFAAPVGKLDGVLAGASAAPQDLPRNATRRVDATRYCTIYTPTGSHILRKECHTRQGWIDLTGADPVARN